VTSSAPNPAPPANATALPANIPKRVALKIIKPGMDSKAVVDRFDAERQALTMMHHPGIATIFTGGLTAPEQGSRPYFAMELVQGMPISKCSDALCLNIRERCELFIRVCDAVQHANSKGIIHRDLKPSNVLISRDAAGNPQPKVIDFGIAKALHQRLTDATLYTEQGQLMGTPEYMSPEQADMSGAAVDARTDVYSIGVMLYESLAGQLPFDKHELRAAGLAGLHSVLTARTPPTPSARLEECKKHRDRYQRILDARATEHKRIRSSLPNKLDHIVMKALAIDPAQRYASPSELADDLRRFLDGGRVRAKKTRPLLLSKSSESTKPKPLLQLMKLVLVIALLAAAVWFASTQFDTSAIMKGIKSLNPSAAFSPEAN